MGIGWILPQTILWKSDNQISTIMQKSRKKILCPFYIQLCIKTKKVPFLTYISSILPLRYFIYFPRAIHVWRLNEIMSLSYKHLQCWNVVVNSLSVSCAPFLLFLSLNPELSFLLLFSRIYIYIVKIPTLGRGRFSLENLRKLNLYQI